MNRNRTSLWIVHRDERLRAALRRLAGTPEDEALLGAPDDQVFRNAPHPGVVLLGLAGDFEAELEFAHRLSARLPAARWVVLVDPRDQSEAERLFDGLAADWLGFPPTAVELRQRIRETSRRRAQDELSTRKLRDALAARFARIFSDLELPEILRALDPRLSTVPLLLLGEPGTGRGILARYVHTFGNASGAWLEIVGRGIASAGELRAALSAPEIAADLRRDGGGITVCLRDVDALPAPAQYALCNWLELGLPGPLAQARRIRWVATAGDEVFGRRAPGLAPELAEALAGLAQRVPPLRERAPDTIRRFAADTILEWARARGDRPRTLAPDAETILVEHPWPGNFRELEAVLYRTLAGEYADPIRAEHLRFEVAQPAQTFDQQIEADRARREAGGDGDEPTRRRPPADDTPARAEAPLPPLRRSPPFPEPSPAAPRAEAPGAPAAPPPAPPGGLVPGREAQAKEAPAPPPGPAPDAAAETATYQRIAQSLAHEIRNRLVSVRTFAELLPERAADRAFTEEFAPAVGSDVRRIDALLERLASFADLPRTPARDRVDVGALLERQIDALRPEIEARRLLVLKELERSEMAAVGDLSVYVFAFETLLARALAWVPERGDLYLASKSVAQGLRGGPTIRVVLRFHRPGERRGTSGPGYTPSDRELALDVVLAELAVRSQRGALRIDASDAEETAIVVDLPAA